MSLLVLLPMPPKSSLQNSLSTLVPFMLTSSYLSKSQRHLKDEPVKEHKIIKPQPSPYLTPPYSDKLFWCLYIILEGEDSFQYVGQKVFTIETEMKIKLVELVREKKALLKQHKLASAAAEAELANNPWISISTFHALCIIHNLSCIVIQGKKCYKINVADIESNVKKPFVIHSINNSFALELDADLNKIATYYENYWIIGNWEKPLLSISAYKLHDLHREE